MESSRRDLFIDMVVDRFIFKNNQITLSPCFAFIPRTGVRLPAGVSFVLIDYLYSSILPKLGFGIVIFREGFNSSLS